MSARTTCAGFLTGLSLLLFAAPAVQAADFADTFRDRLHSGRTAEAIALAEAAAADPAAGDGTAQAALGVARFLGAVEGLVQSLHRYGLNNGESSNPFSVMGALPFLRLPIPNNPDPEPVSYGALRDTLRAFGDGLASAEATLAAVGDRPVALELDLARIRLDLDGDGEAGGHESLTGIFRDVAGPYRAASGTELTVDFDSSDVVWLQAYAHVLMTMSDFLLAHDWEAAYEATFAGLFPRSFTPRTPLNDYVRGAIQRLAEIESRMPPWPECQQWQGTEEEKAACFKLYRDYWADEAVQEKQSLENVLTYGSIADLIAFVHLNRWPVVEPERLASALGHLESMVTLSRENWRRILAETDQGREWIPNPAQKGVLRTMVIDQARVDGWLGFLDQFERVLKGESLLPHWRFEQGFNLRRMFLEPQAFDIVMLIQGSAILPYLEDGPIAGRATWSRATEVFGGDFFSYFIWIN